MDFSKMDISTVTHGKRGDGVRYLRLFLQEYTSVFNERVNPGCPKCLTQYLTKYKNHLSQMANNSKYRLHAKYENIPLEFGSPILINNGNITDAYAQKLLQQKNGERYFSCIPTPEELAEAKSKRKKPALVKKTVDIPKHPGFKGIHLENDDLDANDAP